MTISEKNLADSAEFLGGEILYLVEDPEDDVLKPFIKIPTARGDVMVKPGDIITLDVQDRIKILRMRQVRMTGKAPIPKNYVVKKDLDAMRRVIAATRKDDDD